MARSRIGALLSIGLAVALTGATEAAEPVDLRLVLASDVSRSVNDEEFALQRAGYAAALRDPRVIAAITSGPLGRIAATFVEWADADKQRTVIGWRLIRDEATADAFARALEAEPRAFSGDTAIGPAIDYAMRATEQSGFDSARRVIDVSGDGISNDGRVVTLARDEAVSAGYTINGLAIHNTRVAPFKLGHTNPPGGIKRYYEDNVIGGPAAFALMIEGFDSFAQAITEKLILEIAGVADPVFPRYALRLR